MPYARIIEGAVAAVFEERPTLGPRECAQIVECGEETEVGWPWTPGGCVAQPVPGPNATIDAQIAALEATVTQRRLREAALTSDGKTWLANVDTQIAALRAQRV